MSMVTRCTLLDATLILVYVIKRNNELISGMKIRLVERCFFHTCNFASRSLPGPRLTVKIVTGNVPLWCCRKHGTEILFPMENKNLNIEETKKLDSSSQQSMASQLLENMVWKFG